MNNIDNDKQPVGNTAPAQGSSAASNFPEAPDQCGGAGDHVRSPRIPSDDRTDREKEEDDRAEELYWDDQREMGYDAARDYASSHAAPLKRSCLGALLREWRHWIVARRE